MKSVVVIRPFVTILFLVCVSVSPLGCATNLVTPPLPKIIRTTLDQKYPGWLFSKVSKDIYEFLGKQEIRLDPNLITGDFDGNGSKDYAVQITHGKKRIVIAFLRNDDSFADFILESDPVDETDLYLWLFKSGEHDFDYETGEEFLYAYDSIGVLVFEKSGVSYVFEKGKFRKIWSSD